MNFRQLEAFSAVLQQGSFSKAAEMLYLTQPTISAHIGALEEELGTTLLQRGHKPIIATAAGTAFYEYAMALLRMRDNALHNMRKGAELYTGSVELYASTVPAEYILPALLASFHEQYPHIRLILRESDSQRVLGSVLAGEAELGFVGVHIPNEKCSYELLYRDRLVLAAPNMPPYTEFPRGVISEALLNAGPLILRHAGSGTRREADAFLTSMGVAPQSLRVCAYMDSIESIKRAVQSGLGMTLLSRIAVRDMEARGELLVFESSSAFSYRNLYCVHRTDKPLSPAGELLRSFIARRSADENDRTE